MGRQREREPDPATPAGQCALFLAHLLQGRDVDEFAKTLGASRSTVFNYLACATEPNRAMQDRLAKALGLPDYRALTPSDEFLASIGQKPKARRKR